MGDREKQEADAAVASLLELIRTDPGIDVSHSNADEILLVFLEAIGHSEVSDAYKRVRESLGFYYA
jgi:hypothetical protein